MKKNDGQMNFFGSMVFSMPISSTNLTKKRKTILTQLIQQAGGLVFDVVEKDTFIVVESTKQSDLLKAKLQSLCIYFPQKIISDKFIVDCLNKKQLLPLDNYKPFSKHINEKHQKQFSQPKLQKKQTYYEKKQIKQVQSEKKQKRQIELQLQDQSFLSAGGSSQVKKQYKITVLKPQIDEQERKRKSHELEQKKQKFLCHKGSQIGLNDFICQQLEKLQKIYQTEKDKGRAIAYRKAAAAIRTVKVPIRQQKDIEDVPGIGPKIKKKIIEIVKTGRLTKLEVLQADQKHIVVAQLTKVWGIGPATAVQLYNQGINTVAQLRKRPELLNKNQSLGLKYFQQFQQRMGRQEVEQIQKAIKKQAMLLNPFITMQTCGSYRRGKATCGDIDIIFTEKDGKFDKDFLHKLIAKIQGTLLTDHLSIPKGGTHQSMSYMGVCKLPGSLHRRIDLKHYPIHQFAFAILYFTGSDMFNRSIRLFARKKGYSLSDHGLVPVQKRPGQKKWQGPQVICFTEEDIFKFLGLDYKLPSQRNV